MLIYINIYVTYLLHNEHNKFMFLHNSRDYADAVEYSHIMSIINFEIYSLFEFKIEIAQPKICFLFINLVIHFFFIDFFCCCNKLKL